MSPHPACCAVDARVPEVARLMVEHDCGLIPVVQALRHPRPVGVITDRDITCRVVAPGRNPADVEAAECMSGPVISVYEDTSEEECARVMELNRVRRLLVLDGQECLVGVISQADIARRGAHEQTAEVVEEVSRPKAERSATH
jgi:CBS domain-containing protein